MKKIIVAAIIAMAATTTAFADKAPAATAAVDTSTLTIGEMMDNPAYRAILDKYLPGFSGNQQVEMARGMSLRAVQPFSSGQISDDALAKIDADLAKVAAK